MAPKKDPKQNIVLKEDKSGIPKQDVIFKFEFEIKQQNLQNYVLMWEWFSPDTAKTERNDAQLIENWQQKNDPSLLTFSKEYPPLRVDDDFCKLITSQQFYIYFVNAEDSKIKQELNLDYSQLLTCKDDKVEYNYKNNKLIIYEIEEFSLKITADKPLLTPLYKHYINPMEIEIVGAKDVPVLSDKNYEPCYVQYQFFDGTSVKTSGKVPKKLHDKDELINTKIKQELLLVDIEAKIREEEEKNKPQIEETNQKGKKPAPGQKAPPKKEEKKEPAAAAKKDPKKDAAKKKGELKLEPIKEEKLDQQIESNNYGVACFFLTDLLQKNIREIKLRSPIVPVKKYQDVEQNNLDLNTTAKRNVRNALSSTNYFDSQSFLVVSFHLSFPLGSFKVPVQQTLTNIPPVEEKKDPKKKEEKKPQQKTKVDLNAAPQEVIKVKESIKPVFERVVYFMPYKSQEMVEKIQEAFYEINMKAANVEQGGVRALTTKKLTEEEKNSKTLDFLGGFEIIDDDFRLFVLEGLSEGAMKIIEEKIPRKEPNNNQFKILKNPDIKFQERLYTEFNYEIKRIRLRDTLKQILIKPDIYIRTKVPENICKTLNQIAEIGKCWDMKTVNQFDLFPLANDLISMERKYSDSLTPEDIHGKKIEQKKAKKKQQGSQLLTTSTDIKTQNKPQSAAAAGTKNTFTMQNEEEKKDLSLPKSQKRTLQTKTMYQHKSKLKGTIQKNDVKIRNLVQIPENEQVYIYSCQKLNWYEKLNREQREKIKNDKNNFYTYSEQYLGLSIDPYNVQDEQKLAETLEKTKLQSKPVFRPVPPRPIESFKEHPKKPHISVIEDLAQNPYYQQREKMEESHKFSKERVVDNNKEQFKLFIKQQDIFSQPEVLEVEKITPVEKERQEREKKQKEIEEWKKRLKGDQYIHIKNQLQHPSQTDKLQDIRDGPAIKKGILLKNSRMKESTLPMDRSIKDLPSSIFHKEEFHDPTDFFQRKNAPEKAVCPYDFDLYQNPEILTKTQIYKPLKLDPMFK